MFLFTVNLFDQQIKVFVDNNLFVMPRNSMTMGRVICKWLKYNFADVILAAKFCDYHSEWYYNLYPEDIITLNQRLPFHIYSLIIVLNGERSELTFVIEF